MRVITFKAEDEFIEKLHKAMNVLGYDNRSDLIRQALTKIMEVVDGSRKVVCLELTTDELMYLNLISRDPAIAIKRLIRISMASPADTLLNKTR